MLLKLTILPGDGIGPEVTEQAVLVLQAIADGFGHHLQLQHKLIGGAALTAANDPLPADTLQACLSSSAVLLGAVGSPAFDHNPGHLRPEAGLLRIRRELGSTPICDRRFSSLRLRILPRCARKSCAAPTS